MGIKPLPLFSHLHEPCELSDVLAAAFADSYSCLMRLADPGLGRAAVPGLDLIHGSAERYPERESRLLVFESVIERLSLISELLKVSYKILVALTLNHIAVYIHRMQLDIRIDPEIQSLVLLSHSLDAVCNELKKLPV